MSLPFGARRARLRKFSPSWFVAIHLPVVLAIGMRILMGVPFRLITLPLYVVAFFLGQLAGGRLRQMAEARDLNAKTVSLRVTCGDTAARRLYEQLASGPLGIHSR
jgi:hypothetical protein